MTVSGDGQQTRSFCYVDDLVDALTLFMESDADFCGPVNLGNPQETTILDLATLILQLTDSRSKLAFADVPENDPKRRCPDISLAKKNLAWSPQVSLEDGLRRTIDYFRRELCQ